MNGAFNGSNIVQYGTAAERAALDTSLIKPLSEWYDTDTGAYWKWFGSWTAWTASVNNPQRPLPFTLTAGKTRTFVLKEGDAFILTSSIGVLGTVQRIDVNGTILQSFTVLAGNMPPIGPYFGAQKFLISCTAGSVSASVGDAVLWAASVPLIGGVNAPDGTLVQSLVPQLTRLYTAIAKVISGKGRADIALIDDSTGVGAGGGTGGKGLIGARPYNPAAYLVSQLIAQGIPAANDSFFGEMLIQAFNSTNYDTYDTRFSVSGGASNVANGGYQSLGGIPWQLNSAGKAINFAPSNAVDTVDIYYMNRSVGVFDCSFAGGGSLGTTTTTGAITIQKVTKTFARGSGTFSISWVSGDVKIIGAVFTDSTTPRVNVLNLSCYGDRLTSSNGYVYQNTAPEARGGAAIALLSLSATIVSMTINSQTIDGINGIPAFETALRGMCDYVLAANSDLMILAPHRIATTDATEATQAAYVATQYRVASDYKIPVIDFSKRIPDKVAYAALFFDSKHLAAAGSAMKARTILPYVSQQ